MEMACKYARQNPESRQETYTVGLVLIHSPPCWQVLSRQHRIIMHRVQKETSAVISLDYIFYIEIVDFFFGWNLFEMIKDILQSTQI